MSAKPVVNFDRYPEERQDPLTGKTVIIASARSLREKKGPFRFFAYDPEKPLPEFDPDCHFCPGHEERTTPEHFRVPCEDTGWRVRVFDNLYPFFVKEEPAKWRKLGDFLDKHRKAAVGAHRVLVGTPFHNKGLTQIGTAGIADVFEAILHSYFDLRGDPRFTYFLCFGNYGAEAGASQKHFHLQMVAKRELEPEIRERFIRPHTYWLDNGNRCLACHLMEEESRMGLRIAENEDFVAHVPFASAYTYQIRIFPKEHHSSYPNHFRNNTRSLRNCAGIVRDSLLRIKRCLQEHAEDPDTVPDPPYNLGLHTARLQGDDDQGTFHYHFELHPRVNRFGGYEYNSGQIICPHLPEEMAETLRSVNVES